MPAPGDWTVPRTGWGVPDLQGIWTNATLTPIERPDSLSGKTVLTAEEAVELETRSTERRAASDRFIPGEVGAYNQFWMDGRKNVTGDRRTSLIVDPADGRVPSLTPQAIRQVGSTERHVPGRLPVRYRIGGTGADGPEERGLAARCLMGYNAGPPMLPGGYNNNAPETSIS